MIYKKIVMSTLVVLFTATLPVQVSALPARDNPTQDDPEQQIPMEDVQRFSNALSLIKKYYVKQVDDKILFDNAIRGMLNGLDAHSSYLDEDETLDAYKEIITKYNKNVYDR